MERYIFKNRVVHPNGVPTSPHTWEYFVIEGGKVVERFDCQPSRAKELAKQHGLIPASFMDCRRMGVF